MYGNAYKMRQLDHRQIIFLYQSGFSKRELAKKSLVSSGVIKRILRDNKIQVRSRKEAKQVYYSKHRKIRKNRFGRNFITIDNIRIPVSHYNFCIELGIKPCVLPWPLILHHIDHDEDNDVFNNLMLWEMSEHVKYHNQFKEGMKYASNYC